MGHGMRLNWGGQSVIFILNPNVFGATKKLLLPQFEIENFGLKVSLKTENNAKI